MKVQKIKIHWLVVLRNVAILCWIASLVIANIQLNQLGG